MRILLLAAILLVQGCAAFQNAGYRPVAVGQPVQTYAEAVRWHDTGTKTWCALVLNGRLSAKAADKLWSFLTSMGAFLDAYRAEGMGANDPATEDLLRSRAEAERGHANDLLNAEGITNIPSAASKKSRDNWHLLPPDLVQRCGALVGLTPGISNGNP